MLLLKARGMGAAHAVKFSPDGALLACAYEAGVVYLWDLATATASENG